MAKQVVTKPVQGKNGVHMQRFHVNSDATESRDSRSSKIPVPTKYSYEPDIREVRVSIDHDKPQSIYLGAASSSMSMKVGLAREEARSLYNRLDEMLNTDVVHAPVEKSNELIRDVSVAETNDDPIRPYEVRLGNPVARTVLTLSAEEASLAYDELGEYLNGVNEAPESNVQLL
jgi:hypothetical protein